MQLIFDTETQSFTPVGAKQSTFKGYITATQYAKQNYVTPQAVRAHFYKGRFERAFRCGSAIFILRGTPYPVDNRVTNTPRLSHLRRLSAAARKRTATKAQIAEYTALMAYIHAIKAPNIKAAVLAHYLKGQSWADVEKQNNTAPRHKVARYLAANSPTYNTKKE